MLQNIKRGSRFIWRNIKIENTSTHTKNELLWTNISSKMLAQSSHSFNKEILTNIFHVGWNTVEGDELWNMLNSTAYIIFQPQIVQSKHKVCSFFFSSHA